MMMYLSIFSILSCREMYFLIERYFSGAKKYYSGKSKESEKVQSVGWRHWPSTAPLACVSHNINLTMLAK